MTFFKSIFLGFVQGLTEFLPVSSSGHLIIFQKLLNIGNQIEFDVFLHFATLFAVMIYFRNDILEILKGIFGKSEEGLKTLIGIIVASVPTAVIGLLFKKYFEEKFSQPRIVLVMLILTGLILWFSSKFSKSDSIDKDYSTAKISDFLLIGLFQGFAIMPGISRAGITISAALLLGFNRKYAFKYSMLLSVPAILGAGLLELKHFSINTDILAGGIIAMLSGILSLYVLSKILISRKFHLFSYYLWIVGIVGLIFL
ncbi:MAG: undecaprenyl-diphosphate phosphatase [Elusimicrobia bacterium]|nr:undecaprenyl-diphosphate phosphatase [Elusimicrobiota bacterium]